MDDRSSEFGQYLTAGQLLFEVVGRLRRFESELGVERDTLVGVVAPFWVGAGMVRPERLPFGYREP